MALAMGLLMKKRDDDKENCSTVRHPRYVISSHGILLAALGSLIIFVFFPLLTVDIDTFHGINNFNIYVGPLSLVLAMAAAIMGAVITSCLINGYLIARDIIHAPIAGAIISGSSTFFITNNFESLIAGFLGGMIQTILQNRL